MDKKVFICSPFAANAKDKFPLKSISGTVLNWITHPEDTLYSQHPVLIAG